jgi:IS605 OrfB family transposase
MKKKKKIFHTKEDLSSAVENYRHIPYISNHKLDKTSSCDITTNSWFNINTTDYGHYKSTKYTEYSGKKYYAKKYRFFPTQIQLEILKKWNHNIICIHNSVLKKIKKTNNHSGLKWNEYRDEMKKDGRNSKYYNIPQHIIDLNIKRTVAMFKTANTNQKNGFIRHYRIRYKRHENYCSKSIYIGNDNILKNGSISSLGNLELYEYENKKNKFELCKRTAKSLEIKYVKPLNEYLVYISYQDDKSPIKSSKAEFISLDPGVRTFMTGVTPTDTLSIGDKCSRNIHKLLKDIDRTKLKKGLTKIKKDRHNNRIRNKIKNKVDDLHWKSISFLTENYNKILIGDLSPKGVVSKEKSVLKKITKRILLTLSFFKFRERLEYKCQRQGVEYEMINEFYSSKTCSICGSYNSNLGSNKIFSCDKCMSFMDRDVNGARNIYHIYEMNRS